MARPQENQYLVELRRKSGIEQAEYLTRFFREPLRPSPQWDSTTPTIWRLNKDFDQSGSRLSLNGPNGPISVVDWKAHVPQVITNVTAADAVTFSPTWNWSDCHFGHVLVVDAADRTGLLAVRAARQGFRSVIFLHRTRETFDVAQRLGDYNQMVLIDVLVEEPLPAVGLKVDISLRPKDGIATRNIFGYIEGSRTPNDLILLVTTYGTEGFDNTAGLAILLQLLKDLETTSLRRSVGFAAVYGKSPFRNTASLLTRQLMQAGFERVVVLDFHFAAGEVGKGGVRIHTFTTPFTKDLSTPSARLRTLLESSGLNILPDARPQEDTDVTGSSIDFFEARIPSFMIYANPATTKGFSSAEIERVSRALHTWVVEVASASALPAFLDGRDGKCHVAP